MGPHLIHLDHGQLLLDGQGKKDDAPNKEDSVNKDKEDRRQTRDPYPEGGYRFLFFGFST